MLLSRVLSFTSVFQPGVTLYYTLHRVPGEIKSREVELDPQEGPGEIKNREVELDPQENPGETKSMEVELGSHTQ